MGVVILGNYIGNKKVKLIHEPSGTELLSDAPRDNQGEGTSFSPTDLVAAAFGACALMTIAIFAEREKIDLSNSGLRVEKTMSPPPRRIGKLEAELHLPAHLSSEQRERFERIADACPVHRSLHPEMEIVTTYLYDR